MFLACKLIQNKRNGFVATVTINIILVYESFNAMPKY